MYKFDKFWVEEEPESIMEFNHYREKFHDNIKIQLLDPAVALTMTISPKSNWPTERVSLGPNWDHQNLYTTVYFQIYKGHFELAIPSILV